MPKLPLHTLIWSPDHNSYELYTHGQLEQCFRPGEDDPWLTWLAAQTAVAFHGRAGHLNLSYEARPRQARSWYASRASGPRTRKCYLGQTANLTFARLEQVARTLTSAQSPAPRTPVPTAPEAEAGPHAAAPDGVRPSAQQVLLLQTKLAPPPLPAALVVRERLLKDLDAALAHRLTLLSASAGWGKTTLLSAWAASRSDEVRGIRDELSHAEQTQNSRLITQNYQVAWVSLDALDNDVTRFWVALIAALRTCVPGIGEVALAMLHAPQPPSLFAILTALLNDLAAVAQPSAPILLILDDYHVIDDEAIHEALTFWLEHLPSHLHLLLASRVDPDLPLARWRVRGELAEIRAADLRFTGAEATTFFTQALGGGLAAEDVLLLEQRTEGWIAGLQLAALAMRQRADRAAFIQGFTGSHRYVLDYIEEEVLQRQPLKVQRFLLQTAVLTRLNAGLCAALMEEPRSQAMLEWLERNNLFVVPLDEARQWYRVHDLVREVLLARLQATEPELVPRLHQRAAHWYAAQDELREAIGHALAAANFAYAADLMERIAAQIWLSGEAETMSRWIMALPDAILCQHARLATTTALYLRHFTNLLVEARWLPTAIQIEKMLTRVEEVLNAQEGPALLEAEKELVGQRIRQIRRLIEMREILKEGDRERLRVIDQEAQNQVREDELVWNMTSLSISFMLRERVLGDGGSLIPALLNLKQQARQARDTLATVKVMQWLAHSYMRTGQLRQGHRECVEALELLKQAGGYLSALGYLHYYLAYVFYHWNRLEEARASLEPMFQYAHAWQHVDLLTSGYFLFGQVLLATNDLSEAEQVVRKLEQLVQGQGFTYQHGLVTQAQVQFWLKQGNLVAAGDWAARYTLHSEALDLSSITSKEEHLLLARVYLVQQQYMLAIEVLTRLETALTQPENIMMLIDVLALLAVALYSAGEMAQAQKTAARLLHLTEREGYLRVHLDAGEPMQRLLQSLLSAPRDQENSPPTVSVAFVSKLLAAFPRTESPGLRTEYQIPGHSVLSPQSSALVEPLTRREQEVLRLLVAGASNQEIATELVISLATVKKHVSNLLGKLGVDSRTQAVARARDWSLL
jgi:LuxR family maltose regulon positive regulatory protein